MRFAIPFTPGRGLRLSRNISDWPTAFRFALYIMPVCLCLVMVANWLGYRAASVSLTDSLNSLPLFEAKAQATRMGDTLEQLRHSLTRIAKSNAINAQSLHDNIALFFQDNAALVREIGYISTDGTGFLLLRDNGGFKVLDATEGSQGPYSPFQQIAVHRSLPGMADLHVPVYFDDPTATAQQLEARSPVMRMTLTTEDNRGTLVLGIDLASWRNQLASYMQPGSPLRTPAQDDSMQLAFYFDTRGWILFEMDNTGSKNYLPDLARAGYGGDLGRPGFDAAFRPWSAHERFWHMVTEIAAGRSGSVPAPANKYIPAQIGSDGFLCFAPVLFTPADDAPAQTIGGLAFFETSSLPLAAFLRFANYALGLIVASLVIFGILTFMVSRKLATPMRTMADNLGAMAEASELAYLNTPPASEEQQKLQAAVNTIIADAMAARRERDRLTREMTQARSRLPADLTMPLAKPLPDAEFGLVGSSTLMREVREHVRKAARAGTDVLVWGETGTGKELVAAAIHKAGKRSSGSYISINCGALDENLLLDALFGHVKGAFSEAKADRKGAFLAADGGTLHLDEIANASLKVQQSLLRALSVRRIRPLGTDEELPFNTRVVAATNVDLRECVRAGTFREDLYFRLAIISIETPPLRHRKEDIPELAAYCIHDAAAALGRPEARLSRGALELMAGYDWPGNVREFKNCLTRAMAFVEGDLILRQHITLEQDAFRTYAKPISPRVLAEKLHPADPSLRQPNKEGISQPQGGQRSVSPVDDLIADHLWPPPPRDNFTPSRPAPAEQDEFFSRAQPGDSREPSPDLPPWRSETLPYYFPYAGQEEPSGSMLSGTVAGSRAAPYSGVSEGGNTEHRTPQPASPDLDGLNERQLRALAFVRERGEITRPQYEAVAGQDVSSRTAQNDLRELVDRGFLKRIGAGPGTRYVIAGAA